MKKTVRWPPGGLLLPELDSDGNNAKDDEEKLKEISVCNHAVTPFPKVGGKEALTPAEKDKGLTAKAGQSASAEV